MRFLSVLMLVLLAACRVEKTTDEQPQVETSTRVETAVEEVREGAEAVVGKVKKEAEEFGQSPTGQKIKEGAKQVGEGLETAARDAAVATGKGIEKVGKEIQEHAKPDDQP